MGYVHKDVEKTKKIAKKFVEGQKIQNNGDRSCLEGTEKSIDR